MLDVTLYPQLACGGNLMDADKGFREEFIEKMSKEIIKELEENAKKSGRKLTFDDIETGVLLFRQKIGEEMTDAVIQKQGTGKLSKKKL